MTFSNIAEDEMGFYVTWYSNANIDSYETLRTRDYKRAEDWRIQGNCHGRDNHHLNCPNCENWRDSQE